MGWPRQWGLLMSDEIVKLREQRNFWIRQATAFAEHADNMRLALLEPCGAMLREPTNHDAAPVGVTAPSGCRASRPCAGDERAASGTGKTAWIPVSERSPNGEAMVLVWSQSNGLHLAYLDSCQQWRDADDNPGKKITHWMPLPAPPEAK